eukprot:2005489-Rhodomonas_salina.5
MGSDTTGGSHCQPAVTSGWVRSPLACYGFPTPRLTAMPRPGTDRGCADAIVLCKHAMSGVFSIMLHNPYAMSGTDVCYAATRLLSQCHAELGYDSPPIVLARSAVSWEHIIRLVNNNTSPNLKDFDGCRPA